MYNSDWYNSLIKPSFAPPDWIFAPTWGFLYVTILISIILYSIKPAPNKKSGYIFFVLQLFFNFLWSPVFFGMQNMKLGLIIIILMIFFTILTVKAFIKISKESAILLIPYLLWIIFAACLNTGYIIKN